jgi:hypothetical protein
MYSGNPYQLQQALEELARRDRDRDQSVSRAALRLYRRTSRQGWLTRIWLAVTGRKPQLLDLRQIESSHRVDHRSNVGFRTVALRLIRGSEGRCRDFDAAFRPLQAHCATRWLAVATARKMGIALPPVNLIQVGDIYFVRDGHHRISVARALGQADIEAEVTVWHVANAPERSPLRLATADETTWLAPRFRPALARLSLLLVALGGWLIALGLPPYPPAHAEGGHGHPGALVP